ncbi:heavy-metal-associated domain-containing protein [Pelagibacterium sp.]|uniref:heavy-metal-associated domain-containing protein n=1 Tax=Pelagibacterium sp. TaxID=1967288 RepID=UPI003A8D3D9B
MEFRIENMTCGGCANSVTKAIQSIDPTARIQTDPSARSVKLETVVTSLEVQEALAEAGYPAAVS